MWGWGRHLLDIPQNLLIVESSFAKVQRSAYASWMVQTSYKSLFYNSVPSLGSRLTLGLHVNYFCFTKTVCTPKIVVLSLCLNGERWKLYACTHVHVCACEGSLKTVQILYTVMANIQVLSYIKHGARFVARSEHNHWPQHLHASQPRSLRVLSSEGCTMTQVNVLWTLFAHHLDINHLDFISASFWIIIWTCHVDDNNLDTSFGNHLDKQWTSFLTSFGHHVGFIRTSFRHHLESILGTYWVRLVWLWCWFGHLCGYTGWDLCGCGSDLDSLGIIFEWFWGGTW